jgi:hypothetical protein
MDAQYNIFIQRVKNQPCTLTQEDWAEVVSRGSMPRKNGVVALVHISKTPGEILSVLLSELKLEDPSEEVEKGLTILAASIASRRAEELRRKGNELLELARSLRGD